MNLIIQKWHDESIVPLQVNPRFICRMESELDDNHVRKGNWREWTPSKLKALSEIKYHVTKLESDIMGNTDCSASCADIANLCMMLFSLSQRAASTGGGSDEMLDHEVRGRCHSQGKSKSASDGWEKWTEDFVRKLSAGHLIASDRHKAIAAAHNATIEKAVKEDRANMNARAEELRHAAQAGEWECPDCKTRYVQDVGKCGEMRGCSRPNVVPVAGGGGEEIAYRKLNRDEYDKEMEWYEGWLVPTGGEKEQG